MFILRDYQKTLVNKCKTALLTHRGVIAVCPTGGGKTVCFCSIVSDFEGARGVVAHRREIIFQISNALAKAGVKHRIIAPDKLIKKATRNHLRVFGKSFIDDNSPVGVASVQTLTSKKTQSDERFLAWARRVSLAVFDEGHHYIQRGQWALGVEVFQNAKRLFVTATPERADGVGLGSHAGGFADIMVEGPTLAWLVSEGYLSSFKYKAPRADIELNDIPITPSGELSSRVMRERIIPSQLVGNVVAHYQEHAPNKRAIVFANDVDTAKEHAAAFQDAGISAAWLSGDCSDDERDGVLESFEAGDTKVLVNCELFDEGFDVPAVEAVILAKKTESLGKFLQMVGRVLRVVYAPGYDLSTREGRLSALAAGGKPNAVIIDPMRNWERHFIPTWPRLWSLDSREKGSARKKSDAVPARSCTACTQPYEAYLTECPYCGEVPQPARRSTPEQVDGDLFELDQTAMDALLKRARDAQLGPQDYSLKLIRDRVPRIGRARMLRLQAEAVQRRAVLGHLIEFWTHTKMAGGLSERAAQKLFYFTFGMDVLSATALKADDTDKLAERVINDF